MSNNEIHNYINEQTTPTDGDFMDLDADQGGGSYLSKKIGQENLLKIKTVFEYALIVFIVYFVFF